MVSALRTPQRIGLRLAAAFRHRLGKVGKQHREPQPQCDLQIESEARLPAHSFQNEQHRGHHAAHFHHEHHRIAHHGHGMQLDQRIPGRAAHDLHVPQTAF